MKSAAALAAAVMLAAPSEPPKWSNAIPPTRFNSEGVAVVVFLEPSAIGDACSSVGTPPPGLTIKACTLASKEGAITVMPHPIYWAHDEYYARLMAHELAHLNGWMHEQ